MKSILKHTVISLAILFVVIATASAQTATNTSIFEKNQIIDKEGIEIYSSNLEMKAHKKIGVGVSTGGMIGGF